MHDLQVTVNVMSETGPFKESTQLLAFFESPDEQVHVKGLLSMYLMLIYGLRRNQLVFHVVWKTNRPHPAVDTDR